MKRITFEKYDFIEDNWWIGVDLDGVLAHFDYELWKEHGFAYIGEPIESILSMIKTGIKLGVVVPIGNYNIIGVTRFKIFTARADYPEAVAVIEMWLERHGLKGLEITNVKDIYCAEIWDDRARQVKFNKGEFV